jgi:hypothetical protein
MSAFPVMNLEYNYRSGVNEEASVACIAHETETTEHVKYLSSLAQMPKCHK